jgi:hypothetical protein
MFTRLKQATNGRLKSQTEIRQESKKEKLDYSIEDFNENFIPKN